MHAEDKLVQDKTNSNNISIYVKLKGSLSTIGDVDNINIQESMDLGYGMSIQSWKVLLSGEYGEYGYYDVQQ